METITFYSYKGGTGRTLLVAHTARYLALSGKRVVAMDLDLEAPGLHYRLATAGVPERGVVDYLVDALGTGTAPEAVATYLLEAAVPEGTSGRLWLMPAGPAPSGEYWKRLTQLFQLAPLLDGSGAGLAALLELKTRIESELTPDYLLLDARTGITEVGGVATSVLGDKVVCLFVDNPESIEGTRAVVRSLRHAVRPAESASLQVFPVLSRVPDDLETVRKRTLKDLNDGASKGEAVKEVYVIRADPTIDVGPEAAARQPTTAPVKGAFRDYRFLLSALVPLDATGVSPAWTRHVAVQELIEWLTADEESSRRRFLRMEPQTFQLEQVAEGIWVGANKPQYVDVAAFPDENRTEPSLVALYVDEDFDESTAHRQWQHGAANRVRCVILFGLNKQSNLRRRVYTRSRYGTFVDRNEGWAVRWPLSFSLDDPGDLSTSSLLRAVQAGKEGFIPRLVQRWQHATWFGLHGGFTPDPREAKEIVDGLAAVKGEAAAMILLHTTTDSGDDFELRLEGASMGEHTIRELHAPLWWRLPIEAKRDYQHGGPRRSSSPDAGLQLLASDVMGLIFDQEREFRERAPKADKMRWRLGELLPVFNFAVSDEPPPELVRRAALDPMYTEELPTSRTGAAREKAVAAMTTDTTLGRLLQSSDGRPQVVTTNLLGGYDPARGLVTLYRPVIAWCANAIRVEQHALENVVFLHEAVHALCHLGLDLDGRRWDEFALPPSTFLDFRPSALHEGLAQYFTFRMLERLDDTGMWAAFERLTDVQPPE